MRTSKGDLFLPLATGVRRRYGAMSITTIEHSAERTRCYVVFHEAYEIGLHHHEQAETVWLLDGVMVEKTTGKMFTAGSVHIYSAGEDHDPAYTVPSTAVIEWRPGLPALSSR